MHTDLDLNGKTVLVTGGAGFIGSNLALHIEAEYPDCRVVVFEGFLALRLPLVAQGWYEKFLFRDEVVVGRLSGL